MLKEERQLEILKRLNNQGTVSVNDIVDSLDVSDMTVRRDFDELEASGKLVRVRGGAIATENNFLRHELSHKDKQILNIDEKTAVAKKAASFIEEGDTIFLGPGTTIEMLAGFIQQDNIRVITNCLPVFQTLNHSDNDLSLYLIGGAIRKITQSFHGDIACQTLESMYFDKTFCSANAVSNDQIMTATFEEGVSQKIALNNAAERFLLIDDSKVGKKDFYAFYAMNNISHYIINPNDDALQILGHEDKRILADMPEEPLY